MGLRFLAPGIRDSSNSTNVANWYLNDTRSLARCSILITYNYFQSIFNAHLRVDCPYD